MKGPGGNLVLASGLSFLSYIPFEVVAKGTLLVLAFLFVFDPFPPVSRLLALISCGFVSFLTRAYRNWNEQQVLMEQELELSNADSKDKKE
jgi:hypothetical protein